MPTDDSGIPRRSTIPPSAKSSAGDGIEVLVSDAEPDATGVVARTLDGPGML
ncbi:hypothetical protein [Rhodococcus phenolicus]|uniref:hypothetical protein n=1 Tax=Rhodococcus phenolicus TaxID=263849 RepID=UPI000B0A2B81|nr:hypothetical protein [Rhodococcus phenolicus]